MSPERIAHYRIVSKLGEGGMGTVYRATDTKLNRDVAIKILPDYFAQDGDRLSRFTREAQMLASMNHPNIAAIYGIEAGAIVMELVEGPDLAGPLPLDTALNYARQIVAGLEAAHEKGVIHRDLKPANIKVTPNGVVKLLDFGLAKSSEPSAIQAGGSPTLTIGMTQAGVILGTAAYMAPEQARGKPVDKRVDIWAFGAVLFEMLTGKQLFAAGDTVTDIIAAVVTREPDWTALPAETPRHIRSLLERCLRKDPKLRLRDIGDARLTMDDPLLPGASLASPPRRRGVLWVAAGLGLAVGAAAAIGTAAWLYPIQPNPITAQFRLDLPAGAADFAATLNAPQVVPSPDGRYLAMIATTKDGKTALWVRQMGSPSARRLDKTEEANFPFWSPDSKAIGFFAGNQLKQIALAGASPRTLCEASIVGTANDGGTWSNGEGIVFSRGSGSSLLQVAPGGGNAKPITTLDTADGEISHSWPQFLPDGRHLLYVAINRDRAKSAVYVQELGSSHRVLVMRNPSRAVWTPAGYLLFLRQETLLAQRMDLKNFRLSGEPASVAEGVASANNGRASFAAGGHGVLVYRAGAFADDARLAWRGRDGKHLGWVGKVNQYVSVRVSPDDKKAALTIGPFPADVWIMDLASGVLSRMSNDGRASTLVGPWSPDSRLLASNLTESQGIFELNVGSGESRTISPLPLYAEDWSPDGRFLFCAYRNGEQWSVLPLDGALQPRTIQITSARGTMLRFSPDGKYLAYVSQESGRDQIVVASFPSFNAKRQVSVDGGGYPAWRRDGKELFFQAPDGAVMSLDIRSGERIGAGVPKELFQAQRSSRAFGYWPAGDGQRFLVIEREQNVGQRQMVVVNWDAELKQ